MKSKRLGLGWCLGLGVLGAAACESQVGEHYEGEVQFSIAGTVHGAKGGWRPRLAFVTESEVIFVDGTVTGTFPSKFRFEVTQPPPPEALATGILDAPYERKLAYAYLVMMPGDAPDRLPFLEIDSSKDCDDPDAACVWHETACSPSGSCRERTLDCEACEVIGEVGDPALKMEYVPYTVVTRMVGPVAYRVATYCDAEVNCYREYTECDLTNALTFDTAASEGIERCTILEQSGDTSLVDPSELHTTAYRFVVMYALEQTDTELGTLNPGYNLLEFPTLTREEVLATPLECDGADPMACFFELPMPRVVDGSDVSIDLGLPPGI